MNPAFMTNLQCGSISREGHFDEASTRNGEFRKNFEPFGNYLNSLPAAEFQRRMLQIRHHRAADRLSLDIVPVLYSAKDWSLLSRGLVQRARLWNALLQDIYGPQNVIGLSYLQTSITLSPAYASMLSSVYAYSSCEF